MERKFDNRRGYYQKKKNAPVSARPAETEEENGGELLLEGRHAVREALRAGRSINRLYYADGELDGSARELLTLAREARVVTAAVSRARLDDMSQTHHHQGFIAVAAPFAYTELSDLIESAGDSGLLVVLDGVSDVHNLGSIIRTAVCAGADGLIIPKHRAAAVNAAVVRTSAGAAEYLPVARVTNLSRALEVLKEAGYWINGAAMDGQSMYDADLRGKTVLVIGSEGEGLSRLVRETCDRVVSIPQTGTIDSLNASVAAAVLLYEAYRQRR
ncbi:MAG: 23S rRNA (guanosine(2251)-2'-O)-methyltransferase RlmB [Eubacteriales bacterium]|nr:23S rRNA (guanosine(2251)-2'-O)-methyltransferase RlmB [Eubacteriales bacterium]